MNSLFSYNGETRSDLHIQPEMLPGELQLSKSLSFTKRQLSLRFFTVYYSCSSQYQYNEIINIILCLSRQCQYPFSYFYVMFKGINCGLSPVIDI